MRKIGGLICFLFVVSLLVIALAGCNEKTNQVGLATPGAISYIASVKTKMYHMPDCPFVPNPKDAVYFDSATEAVNRGYSPCAVCKPPKL